jgi:CheY-like chemotaxis protein
MDMQMPVMDGLTAARALRASGFDRPIVSMTANALAEDRVAPIDPLARRVHPREALILPYRWVWAGLALLLIAFATWRLL